MSLRPDEPDYQLWRWIIDQGDRCKQFISDKELEIIRQEYYRIADPGTSVDRPRE